MHSKSEVKFVVTKGPDGLSEISISSEIDIFIVGNSRSADASVSSPFVSRRHFQLRRDTDVFWISDLGSRNGTSVNGKDLTPHTEQVIKNEDIITLSKGNVILQFMEPPSTMMITSVIGSTPTTDKPVEASLATNLPSISINSDTRKVYVHGAEVSDLSRKQFDILANLFSNKGKIISRDDIAAAGWPERPDDVSNAEIDQYIRQIRIKVEENPSKPTLILTRRGHGYMIP